MLSASNTLSYVKKFEIVPPRVLPVVPSSLVPYIGIAPVGSNERFVAQRKETTNNVDIYAITYLQITESAIVGDSVKKGMTEIDEDIKSVIRGHRLQSNDINYLSKPLEIIRTDYGVSGYGDNVYLFVLTITVQCIRLFNITLP